MISIIGYGNLSQALITGLRFAKYSESIKVYDSRINKKIHRKIILKKMIDKEIVKSRLVLLAVKPKDFKNISDHLKELKTDSVIVSLMAGISIKKIRELTGHKKLARVMTNINCAYCRAQSFIYINPACSSKNKKEINNLFNYVGTVYNLASEKKIDIVTGLTGSGPAYVLYFLEAMCDIFQKQGFSKKTSQDLCTNLIEGTINTCKHDKRNIDTIKKSVVSKNGTTEEALKYMKRSGFKVILNKAITAAIEKAMKIGA